MKKITLLITTVLIAGLMVPKFIAAKSQDMYLQGFDNYPKDTTSMSIEHISYEQSWFSSQAVTVLKFSTGMPDVEAVEWIMTSEIQHGPVLFTNEGIQLGFAYVKTASSFAGLPEEVQQFIDENFNQDSLVITALIDLDQLSHDTFTIHSINFEKEKISGTIGGLQVVGTSLLDYSMIKGDIKLPASQIQGVDLSMNIADASGTYDYHKYNDYMMIGKSDITMPSIEVVAKQQAITLKDLSVAVEVTEQDKKLNMAEYISIAKITAPVPVTAFQYNIELNQFDPKAVELWQGLIQRDQPVAGNKTSPVDEEKLRELLTVLLQNGLQLKQLLKLDAENGTLTIDWDTRYVGLAGSTHVLDVQDKTQLLKAVNIHLFIEIDTAIVSTTPFATIVKPYIEKGYVVEKDDKLVADIKLVDGVLTINTQPFPIENILALLGPNSPAAKEEKPSPKANTTMNGQI